MRDKTKQFVLCVHAHQPVGNFEHVFVEAYERSYRPFFETLEAHPRVSAVAHFSGSLLDWLERARPEFFGLIRRLMDRGQIEVLGGAYYEPVFGAVPEEDLAGQIRMTRERLFKLLGATPQGAWLSERVWDPRIVRALAENGVAYTVLDDAHLEKAGVRAPAFDYYRARDGKASVDLFGSSRDLRYKMPFREPAETIAQLRRAQSGPGRATVFADDCEKFGLWPGTHDWVYKKGWLERFFKLLEAEKDVRTVTFAQLRAQAPAKKEIRVPHSSYAEMMEWSGGNFYKFYEKYPESRYMSDRMWAVSEAVSRASWTNGSAPDHAAAMKALYKAQCNCTYWHGVFGGLYLHHLRSAVYENLIEAERLAEKKLKPAAVTKEKFRSGERWKLRSGAAAAYFNPEYGAAMEELDLLTRSVNLMANLRRHREAYHAVLGVRSACSRSGAMAAIHSVLGAKEEGLGRRIFYDEARRLSFMDRFLDRETGAEELRRGRFTETGDFVGAPYRVKASEGSVRFERRGQVKAGGRKHPLEVRKTVAPQAGGVRTEYRIRNAGPHSISTVFAVEFNFSIGQAADFTGAMERRVRRHVFHDAWRGIEIEIGSSEECTVASAPIETVSESEGGLERTYQQLSLLWQRPLSLGPGEETGQVFELTVR